VATKRGVPAERKATAAEVEAAAARLTDAEIAEIYKYAEIRIRVIKGAADSREPHELLNEAFRRTLDLTRTWNMDKSFVQHLRDVIESLSGNWADRYRVQMNQGRDQVVSGRDSRTDEILAETAADPRSEAHPLIPSDDEDRESAILRIFEGDQLALDILNGRMDGLTTDEIIEIIGGMDKTKYLSKVRWMQRQVSKAGLRPRTKERGPRQ
jgi:hypothetical protein